MKILIVKRDKLGDLLLSTPLFAHLHAGLPGAQIHLLANDYNAWVAEGHPAISRLWIYRRSRMGDLRRPGAVLQQIRLIWQLRRERFDFAIVAQGEHSPRAIRRALWAGARRTIAFVSRDHALRARVSDPLDPPRSGHEPDRLLGLAAPLGLGSPSRALYPSFSLPEDARRFALDWLAGEGLRPGGYVVVGLGSRRPRKQPSAAQIARWTAHLKQAHGLDTVFMWTPGGSANPLYPGDDEVVRPVLDLRLPHLHPFRGPIREALGLVWNARTSIFPDSGLMHFAAASPGGTLGLFAELPDFVEQWAPRGLRVAHLDASQSVEELADEQIYAELALLLA